MHVGKSSQIIFVNVGGWVNYNGLSAEQNNINVALGPMGNLEAGHVHHRPIFDSYVWCMCLMDIEKSLARHKSKHLAA
jgi:hypothetical protein